MEAVHGSTLLVFAVIAIALLILLITRYKVYPFLVLIIVSLLLGLRFHALQQAAVRQTPAAFHIHIRKRWVAPRFLAVPDGAGTKRQLGGAHNQ